MPRTDAGSKERNAADFRQGRLARVYSYLNHLGDVVLVARHGRLRELVFHPDGTVSFWLPRSWMSWAAWQIGETPPGKCHEPNAIRWLAQGAA